MNYDPNQIVAEQNLLQDIHNIYCELSPENISCDGELSPSHIKRRYADCHKRLRALFKTLGRSISEDESWNWFIDRKSFLANLNKQGVTK